MDAGEKLDMLRALGADDVLDYTKEDFAAGEKTYDLILDVVGNRKASEIRRALRPGGTYVMVGGSMSRILHTVLIAPLAARSEWKSMKVLVHNPNHEDQLVWKELIEAGRVLPVIDRQYDLEDAAKAIAYFGEGRVQGKVVVNMESSI